MEIAQDYVYRKRRLRGVMLGVAKALYRAGFTTDDIVKPISAMAADVAIQASDEMELERESANGR